MVVLLEKLAAIILASEFEIDFVLVFSEGGDCIDGLSGFQEVLHHRWRYLFLKVAHY